MNLRVLLALMVALRSPALLMAQDRAAISGCVSDATGEVLPGVRVLFTKGPTTDQVVTDSSGCYDARDLTSGTYRVFACLAGFYTAGREDIVVVPGPPATLDFQLRLEAICECIHIPTLARLWQAADVVVRVRLIRQRLDPTSEVGTTAMHAATILTTWKADSRASGNTITFRQPLEAECVPYAVGRELVLFLRWNDQQGAFERVNRENGAFTIENGRITWPGIDKYYGQTTDAFLAAVEATKQAQGQ
jgi:carboxypeptidase family protein